MAEGAGVLLGSDELGRTVREVDQRVVGLLTRVVLGDDLLDRDRVELALRHVVGIGPVGRGAEVGLLGLVPMLANAAVERNGEQGRTERLGSEESHDRNSLLLD